ncbi:helix-turn-helix domain-containing protein [Lacticaseibacillus casei]|nr:helix-turn-helix domain-containing protein [Lacticaseibacillus casei]MDG3062288.1 transcriptional regulator [Lacticaseibacillus sp. BCRC 81376]
MLMGHICKNPYFVLLPSISWLRKLVIGGEIMVEKTISHQQLLKRLGQYFRNRRVGRGLTLKDVSGNLSEATISRFERGELDISTGKALALMVRLGIDEYDLLTLYDSDPINFPLSLQEPIQMSDFRILNQREKAFFLAHPNQNEMTALARILFEAGKWWPDAHYRLTAEEEQMIADRMAVPERFDLLGLELYKAIVGPASHELLLLLRQRAKRVQSDWRALSFMQLLMLWLGALMNRDMALATVIETDLKPIIKQYHDTAQVIEFYPNWQYGLAVKRWLQAPTVANVARIQQIITDLRERNVETDARWFELMFARTQAGSVHHNPALKDRPKKIVLSRTGGEILKTRREYLGLTRADLKNILSVTALRRFESGQTQLSFGTWVRLCGELALVPSQVLSLPNQLDAKHSRVPGSISLRATFKQVANIPMGSAHDIEAEKVIARFNGQLPELPKSILDTQQFILRSAAHLAPPTGVEMQKEASIILSHLLSMNEWGSLETHASAELVRWLQPAQLVMLFQKARRVIGKHPWTTVGVNYIFDGLNRAILQVVTEQPHDVGCSFLSEFKWLLTIGNPSPMRWQAMGSWLIGRYVTAPSSVSEEAVMHYVDQSLRVGHPDAIDKLKVLWHDELPTNFLDSFVRKFSH